MIFKQFYADGTTYEFKQDSIFKLGFNYPEKLSVNIIILKRHTLIKYLTNSIINLD
jgi:hypothetical protein